MPSSSHALQLGERHGRLDLRILQRDLGRRLPVGQGWRAGDGRVGHHAEDA